jgi:hypothetical protein
MSKAGLAFQDCLLIYDISVRYQHDLVSEGACDFFQSLLFGLPVAMISLRSG